jgi:hypothetical protein
MLVQGYDSADDSDSGAPSTSTADAFGISGVSAAKRPRTTDNLNLNQKHLTSAPDVLSEVSCILNVTVWTKD